MTTHNLGIVAPVPKGTWNNETQYEYLNIVTLNGSSYIAKTGNRGIEPGVFDGWETYWTLIAERGTPGSFGQLAYKDVPIYQISGTLVPEITLEPNKLITGYCVMPSAVGIKDSQIMRMTLSNEVSGSDAYHQTVVNFSGNSALFGQMGITLMWYTTALVNSKITKIRVWYLPGDAVEE